MSFEKLIGNEDTKSLLRRLSEKGRVPHAMLFTGPEGVGKKLFAFELARLMLCVNGGCGSCSACTRIGIFDIPKPEKGEDFDAVFLSDYPDVGMVVPYKRNLRVGAIRELEREAHFRPFEADKRIFIINEAEKMNDSSSNALLKTLEEPPATTFLILVTSRPDALLQTIRSRCQTVRFAPVPASQIEELMISMRKLDGEEATLAARVSRGSVGKALSFDVEWFKQTRDTLVGVLRAVILSGSFSSMLQASEHINDAKNKDRYEDAIEVLETLVRDLFAISNGVEAGGVVNADIAAELSKLSGQTRTSDIQRWIAEIEKLQFNFLVNINRKVATDGLFVKMASS
ncbi:MAG TPA: DNA polymerase III subunit delta' [Pyrinomonadaceae bacterium]